jgi:hypothetical protein
MSWNKKFLVVVGFYPNFFQKVGSWELEVGFCHNFFPKSWELGVGSWKLVFVTTFFQKVVL